MLPDVHFFIAGWRLIFLINLPLGLIAVILVALYLKDSNLEKKGKFDHSGVALLTTALIALIYPLVRGRELHWPWWSIAMIGSSFVWLYLFIREQRNKLQKGKLPLLDVRLFAFKDFNIGLCAVLFYFMVQDTYFVINGVLFQNGFGFSSSSTGIFFVFQGIGYVLASLVSLRLVPVYGKKILLFGVLIMVVSLIFHLIFFNSPSIKSYILLPILFVYGIGCGSVLPSLLTMALKNIPPAFAGAASGTFSTFQQTAIALGIGIVGGLFFYSLDGNSHLTGYVAAYRTATCVNIALLALVSLFLFLLPDGTGTSKNRR